jgi:hypothetical protein
MTYSEINIFISIHINGICYVLRGPEIYKFIPNMHKYGANNREINRLSRNPHKMPEHQKSYPQTRESSVSSTTGMPLFVILQVGIILMLSVLNYCSTHIMDSLGLGEIMPTQRTSNYQFMITRGVESAGRGDPEMLWQSRQGGAQAGFFLATAIHCESSGETDLARLWLGIHFIARGNADLAGPWVRSNSFSTYLDRSIDPKSYAAATWINQEPLVDLLEESIF